MVHDTTGRVCIVNRERHSDHGSLVEPYPIAVSPALALRHHLSADRLLDRAITRALTRRWRYTADTLWPRVYRLTERAAATFTMFGLTIDYPPSALHVLHPRALRPDADPVAALGTLLTTTIGRLPVLAGQTGIELSGGADSANVALTVASLHDDQAHSYAVLLDGAIGRQQQKRRAEIVGALGFRDTTIRAAEHLPLMPEGPRVGPHDPTGEMYLEMFEAARAAIADAGVRVVFTGYGGDENLSRRPAERAAEGAEIQPGEGEMPWLGPRTIAALREIDANLTPAALSPIPTLMAHAVRNQRFLRYGIWPVSPLADPLITWFGKSLPVQWRRGKRLLRDRLRRAGFSEVVATPPKPEVFSSNMQSGLRRYGLGHMQRMLDDSLLVDTGYVDRTTLAAAYRQFAAGGEIPDLLYETVAVEQGLRSLC